MKEQKKDIYGIAKESNIDSNPDSKIFLLLQGPLWGQKVVKVKKKKKVSPVEETLNS